MPPIEPELNQRVEVRIRGARDLPPRVGNVTDIDAEDGDVYVSNMDDFVGQRPGAMFGMRVNPGAWDLDDEDQVYEVRVVAPPS